MEANPRRGKTLSTQIPIYTLSGGVGRQAPSKRLPSEAEEMLNVLCTVERSIEKRPGTDLMPIKDATTNFNGEKLGLDSTDSIEFFWHSLSDQLRFLLAIDRSATGNSDKLFYLWYFDQADGSFLDQTPANQSGIDLDVRAYITYGSTPLKLVTRGQNLVFLNPDVYAGYTSKPRTFTTGDTLDSGSGPVLTESGEYWCQIGLDGQFIGADTGDYVEDLIGSEVTYTTAVKVDPAQIAVFFDTYSPYVIGTQVLVVPGTAQGVVASTNNITAANAANYYYLLQAKQSVAPNSDISDVLNWTVIATDEPGFVVAGSEPALDDDRIPKQIDVKDWQYPDSTQLQLGQSLPTFNNLTIPPLQVDVTDGNNGAEDMFVELYGLTTDPAANQPLTNSADGKVYYIQAGYLGQSPGYYLATSVDTPSFKHVRTPDGYSVIDKKRMPMQLEFSAAAWEWSTIEWEERKSGDLNTNPGPTAFKEGRQSKITTIASFRNRLWFSVGDVLFSSRLDDWTDLWIDDPGVLVDSDPIDIAASTNTYTPITAMVPFREYMFVNTDADVQYELAGSENQITPFTAELQPMTFYSTAPLVEPLKLGNYIFFFDAERLYLYLGRGGTLSTAQELSAHCPKYLPRSFGATTVAPAQDTIMAVDAADESRVYLYTTKYRGNEILQNAFYQFEYIDRAVKSMKAWDNYVYMVVKRSVEIDDNVFEDQMFIERQHIRYDPVDTPRIDRKQKITLTNGALSTDRTAANCSYDPATVESTIRVPFVYDGDATDLIVLDSEGRSRTIKAFVSSATFTDVTVAGPFDDNDFIWIGSKFTMLLQMSTQFVRGDDNNPREGILNVASMLTRHFDTGNYDVVVQRRGRPVADIKSAYESRDPSLSNFTASFSAPQSDSFADSTLTIGNIEYQGELVSKVMGYSDKIEIFILSDYFTPVNITNIQMKGKFTAKYSGVL